jgi:hypothetical protein
MTSERKTFYWTLVVAAAIVALIVIRLVGTLPRRSLVRVVPFAGAVLRQDSDPSKQSPLANTQVTATSSLAVATGTSDASGLFKLTLRPGVLPGQSVTLRFQHPEYKPVELTGVPQDRLYIVRMEPLAPAPAPAVKLDHAETPGKPVQIKDVRVRYSLKSQTTITVGSLAKQFEVANTGNVPCAGHPPCSPDGRWKATRGSLPLDAEKGNEFRNVRVSCIAGPCPFTRIEPDELSRPARNITISVLNWSDTASFLVETEVTRTMVTDTTRRSYPFVVADTMTFALPAAAEGPSIEANLDGQDIVFPLGPNLILSWATCSVEIAPDHTKIHRCELKSGYQFQ